MNRCLFLICCMLQRVGCQDFVGTFPRSRVQQRHSFGAGREANGSKSLSAGLIKRDVPSRNAGFLALRDLERTSRVTTSGCHQAQVLEFIPAVTNCCSNRK